MSEGPANLAKTLFVIVSIALFIVIIFAGALWGCVRWKRNDSHDMPHTQLVLPVSSSQSSVAS